MFWVKNDLNKRSFIRNISQAQASWAINNKWSLQAAFTYHYFRKHVRLEEQRPGDNSLLA